MSTDQEYGVQWAEDDEIEFCEDREHAERLVASYPAWNGVVVVRDVEHDLTEGDLCLLLTPWRPVEVSE